MGRYIVNTIDEIHEIAAVPMDSCLVLGDRMYFCIWKDGVLMWVDLEDL